MICVETQYLNLNRILLLAIGLWPQQQSRFTQVQFILIYAILMTSIIFQLTTFMTTLKYTSDFIITVLSSVSFFIIYVLIYYAFHVNIEIVKKLCVQIQQVCNELKDKNEIAIIKKYGYISKCYTAVLTVSCICVVFANIILQFYTMSEDILLMNVTRPYRMQFVTEYFVDQEKYFFLIGLHMNTAMCIGIIVTLATGTLKIAIFKFICGMFKISSYRIKRAVKINILQNIILKNKIIRSEDLICAIDIHRQAMKLCNLFISKFEMMFFCLVQISVISLCFNFVRVFQIVLAKEVAKKGLLPIIFSGVIILYMFVANYLGQNLIDHNNYLFDTVYRVEWYVTPLSFQKIILFLLLKGAKNFTINIGGLFIASLECFATLVKASVSYFTVILSTQ